MPRPTPVENQATGLQQRNAFAQDKLGAMGELTGKNAERMQDAIANEENAIIRIIRAKTEGTTRGAAQDPAALQTLQYYYKELLAVYYESLSTDTHKLETYTRPLLVKSLQDLAFNDALQPVDKNPLNSIGAKALANIDKRLSVKGKITAKVSKFMGGDGGAVLAGVATKSPLVGLALWAYNRRDKTNKFATEANLLDKTTQRDSLPGAGPGSAAAQRATATPVAEPELPTFEDMPQNEPIEVGGKLRAPLSIEDDEDWMYADGRRTGKTATYSGTGSGGSGGGAANLTPLTAILSRHTELLSSIKSSSAALVRIATRKNELGDLKDEESAFEERPNRIGTIQPNSLTDLIKNKMKKLFGGKDSDGGGDSAIEEAAGAAAGAAAPGILGKLLPKAAKAIKFIGPMLARGLSVLNPVAKVTAAAAGGYYIGSKIDQRFGLSTKIGDKLGNWMAGPRPAAASTASATPAPPDAPTASVAPSTPAPVDSPAPATPTTPTASPTQTVSSDAAEAAELISKEEGYAKKGYWDPPNKKDGVSIGYGHLIKSNELKQGFVMAGDEKVPIKGDKGIDTTITKEQAKKLLAIDVPNYQNKAKSALGNEAWSKLTTKQKAALTSHAYNTGRGGIDHLVKNGLRTAILNNDTQGAAAIIRDKGFRRAGKEVLAGLVQRRATEATIFASNTGDAAAPGRAAITQAINTPPSSGTSSSGSNGTVIAVNAPSTSTSGGAGRSGYIPSPADQSPIINDAIGRRG